MKSKIVEAGSSDRIYVESAATTTEEIYNGVGNPIYPPAKTVIERIDSLLINGTL